MGVEHASPVIAALLIASFLVVFRYIRLSRERSLFIRRIAGIDAIEYGVSSAAEQGRPVSFSTGITGVGPVLYACLGILRSVVRKVATFKTRLVIPQNSPEAMAMVEDTVRSGYVDTKREEFFDPQSVVFLSEEQFAFASGYMGLMHRENVGTAFLFGSFAGESLILAEAGQQVGALQVAGSVSPEQVPFFICTCEYTLIGEELFAASAYLTRDSALLGSLAGQDRIKVGVMLLIILGVLFATIQSIVPETDLPNIKSILTGSEK